MNNDRDDDDDDDNDDDDDDDNGDCNNVDGIGDVTISMANKCRLTLQFYSP
ncbi:hypothetical protein K0M31_010542 [Melipona bicolor]|uniref:Uncharacterized protein n=1 Tax=Melipona bicolor TaxID=60889 RepID=A0AA40KI65_9HYME|nr:hypothetical protein K0M31_010542 [Melipona bicolor]